MKKLFLLLIMSSLICSSPGLVLAEEEIYWGTLPSPESEITDSDFSHKYQGQKDFSLFRDKNIYDVWKPGLFDDEEDTGAVISQPIQEPTAAPQVINRATPAARPELGAPPRNVESARPSSTPASPARVSPSAPKPAETSPGSQEAAVGPGADQIDKPGTKKMRWGQSDSSSTPSEPKTKFEWGQNKSGAQ